MVKMRAPLAPVVQVSAASGQLVAVFALRPQPPLALQLAVYVVTRPLAHEGFPGPHAEVDSENPQAGFAPPPQVACAA